MIQLSLSLGVLGRDNTDKLIEAYRNMILKGYEHHEVSDRIMDYIQDKFNNEIELYCNRNMIFSELKVAEDIVEELKQIRK